MFILPTSTIPGSAADLASSVGDAIGEWLDAAPAITVDGQLPSLAAFRIDLTNTSAHLDHGPEASGPATTPEPGPSVQSLRILANPLRVEDAPIFLDLDASDARFNYARDPAGRIMLLLDSAREGHICLAISHADLESVVLRIVRAFADGHGITIREVRLTFTQLDSRSVGLQAQVIARKLLAATILICGELRIDENLNASFSDLSCSGDGIVGKLVCGLISPRLQRLSARRIALLDLPLGDVQLRDVQLQVGPQLTLTAAFGSRQSGGALRADR